MVGRNLSMLLSAPAPLTADELFSGSVVHSSFCSYAVLHTLYTAAQAPPAPSRRWCCMGRQRQADTKDGDSELGRGIACHIVTHGVRIGWPSPVHQLRPTKCI